MILLALSVALFWFAFQRAKSEDAWHAEQRMFWARHRKDLNEVRKACERR